MNIKDVFKRTIILDVILIVLIFLSVMFESEAVTEFNNTYSNQNDMFIIISLVYLIVYIINLYFLYTFKKIGKQIYLILFVMGVLIVLMGGSGAYDAFDGLLDWFLSVVTGAILVFLYFTPIKKEFDK